MSSAEAFLAELESARGGSRWLDGEIGALHKSLGRDAPDLETRSRQVVELMGMALQASCLIRSGNVAIADAFCESRLGRSHGWAYGTLASDAPFYALVERALPE